MPRNKCKSRFLFLLALLIFLLTGLNPAAENTFSFRTQNGINLRVIQDQQMPFIHAQVIVLFDYSNISPNQLSPGIPALTAFHLFNQEIDEPSSPLLRSMRRLGGDYEVALFPDYLLISLNFPNDRLSLLGGFLRDLFNYSHFYIKKLNRSLEIYWPRFFHHPDWKSILARRLGYALLFPDQPLGFTYLPFSKLPNLNLYQLRSFFQKNFRPHRSSVIVKGNINPHVTLGLLERSMHGSGDAERPDEITATIPTFPPEPQRERKIVFFPTADSEPPLLMWLEALPEINHPQHLAQLALHHALFSFPGGRIYQTRFNQFSARNYQFQSEVNHHAGIAVIIHQVRVNPVDIEPLLGLIDQERRRLISQPLDRREYLEAVNSFLNKAKVRTADFEHEVRNEVFQFITGMPQPFNYWLPNMIREMSLEKTNQTIRTLLAAENRETPADLGTVVIIGNREILARQTWSITVEWIDEH